jgi:LacI family transcriptional regulator
MMASMASSELGSTTRHRVDLQTVADAASVHRSTASRALNPATRHLVAAEAAARIEEAARALGYRRDDLAASLRTGRTNLIGVMVPDLFNPIVAPMLQGVESALSRLGYSAVVANSGNEANRQFGVAEQLVGRRVDGLILATSSEEDPIVAMCVRQSIPAVLVNRAERGARLPAVVSDDAEGSRLAVEHLIALGHRRIGHIAGPANVSTGARRRAGFEAAMRNWGLDASAVVTAAAFQRGAGAMAAAELLDRHNVTAIVAATDLLALGAYRALVGLGLRCPQDVSVIGHDDMPLVDMVSPPLTTIRIDPLAMGERAAALLLDWLGSPAGLEPRPVQVVTRPALVVRGSTMPPLTPPA